MALQPFNGEFEPLEAQTKTGGGGLKPFTGTLDAEKPKQNTSLLGDLGTDLKRGVQQLPGVLTGLADIGAAGLTGRRYVDDVADQLGEATGFQPDKWQEEARQEYSPARQQGTAEIDQAWEDGSAMDVAGAYASNPGNVAGLVAESLPQMLAGGVIGRGALVGARATGLLANPATAGQAARQAVVAGAGGEGAVIAGGTMDQIDREVDPQRAAAAAAGAGVIGGALSGFGARLAQRAGLIDVESALAGGVGQVAGQAPGLGRRVAGGALTEGVLEELPQSIQEQMLQNWAEQKPLMEGVPRAAVEGTLAGSAIGGAVNVARRPSEQMGIDPAAGPLSSAAATAVDGAATPVRDATRAALLNGAPEQSAGGGYQPIDQQMAIAQELFPSDLDAEGNLHFYRYDRDLQVMVEVPEAQALAAAREQLAQAERMGFDPQDTRGLDELVPQVEELPAQPPLATVTSDSGPQSVEQINQPLPLATVEMDTGPQPVEQVQGVPTADDPGYELRLQKNGRPFRGQNDVRLRKLFTDLEAAGESPVVVQHEGGWAVAVPRQPVEPPAPLGLPAPSTMVVDSEGNAQRGAVAPFVEPRAQVRPIGGPGMERQAPASRIDQQAQEAATSPSNALPEPSQAQIEAGNYRKGHVRVAGLDISIENPRGSVRKGKRPDGSEWSHEMSDHYGYIRRTEGADGEQVDVYVGPQEESQRVFIVDQVNQQDGSFDEHKVMLGYPDVEAAVAAYRSNFDAGWQVGPVTELSRDSFRSWLRDGELSKPLQEVQDADNRAGAADERAASDLPVAPASADNVAGVPVVAERPAAAGGEAGSGRPNLPAAVQGADGQRALNDQPTAETPVQERAGLPEILSMPRKRYIDRQAKAAGIKKGSPGYEQAVQRLQGQYEADVDRASAGLTFEQYNGLNGDNPASVNRQAWEALREEYGVASGAQPAREPAPNRQPKVIEDAGEKLGGARKDELRGVRERLESMDDAAIASSTLSQLWPKDEINRIEDLFHAASYQTVREIIPAKPRVPYKVRAWVDKVKAAREILKTLANLGADATVPKMREFSPGLRPIADKIELLMGVDRSQWGRIGRVSVASGKYNDGGTMVPGSWVEVEVDGSRKHFFGKKSVADAISDIRSAINLGSAPESRMKFSIYTDRSSGEVFIVKDGDKEQRRLKTFNNVAEARTFLADKHADLVTAWDAVKNRDNVTKADMRRDTNDERTGRDYRNGVDVTPEQFIEVFGFRGVEFGNWVAQGAGGADRQGLLNQAYDSFMDLADVVGVPPKALSLAGRLGVGFGSRGRGRASAHFEPSNIVINMTKTRGAGSLAHEWFHALDNYFARQRGGEVPMERGANVQQAYRNNNFITYRPEPLYVHKTQRSSPMSLAKLQRYREQNPDAEYFKADNWQIDPRHPTGVRPEVERAFAELVDVLDQSPMARRSANLDKTPEAYWSQIIERGARAFETYVIAKLADQGYRNDYLANVRTLEQFSRAADRYPYLTPDEQGPVSDAFDKLFSTVQTRVDDEGALALYSRASYRQGQPVQQGARAVQLRMQLARLTGGWQNAPKVKVVQSVKDLPDAQRRQVERDGAFDVEGMFADGQVYLVADNLRDVKHAAFVLQHEVLGHAGLQGAYGQRLTPLLMSLYNGNAELKAQADALVQRYGYTPSVAVEEVLADMAGAGTIQQQPFWQRLITAMRNALRSIGVGVNWNESDIQGLLANARAYIVNGRRRPGARDAFSRDGRSGRGAEITDEQGRLLAPNGKPSKLSQKQWHQARSSNFKGWFGNWQGLAVGERLSAMAAVKLQIPEGWRSLSIGELRKRAREALSNIVRSGEPLVNDELGEVLLSRNKGVSKFISESADPAKLLMAADIRSAFRRAVHASSRAPREPLAEPNIQSYERLLAKVSLDGSELVVVFTVQRMKDGKLHFYNAVFADDQANDGQKETPAVSPRDTPIAGELATSAYAGVPVSVGSLRDTPIAGERATSASTEIAAFSRRALERVNPEAVSKVTDGNGEPLVIYHGTAEQFTVFDQTRSGRSTGHSTAPLGIFLTSDVTVAQAYAENATDGMPGLANVLPLFASIKKPYRMSVAESQRMDTFDKALVMRQRLEGEGYDGIQLGDTGTWVAFYNNQVKSATNNTGAFDQVDPDIRYRRSGQATIDTIEGLAGRADTGRTADAFPELSQEARDFLNKVGTPPAVKRASDWVRERTERAATKLRQGIVDRYAALKELDEKLLGKDFIDNAIHSSSWVLARMSSAASGAMNAMLTTGRLQYDAKERVITLQDGDSTGGLSGVLSQLGSAAEVERFMGWIAANRASKLMAEGRENLFTAEEIASGKQLNAGRTSDGKARPMVYAKVFKEFQQYRDDVLSIAEATGVISADSRAMWRDEFYVPFYRVMNEDAATAGPRAGKGLSRQEAYKKLKGGKQNLNDLLENTLMNFHHLLSASLKNQAAAQTMANAERMGVARVVPESQRDPKTSTFVLEKGERVFYEIDDPMVFEALTALADPGLNNLAVETMASFKRLFTNMTTVTPQFILANTMRDLMQASATSPTSKNLFKNTAQGLSGYRDARTRAEMQASGGAFSFGHLYGADVNEVKAGLSRAVKGAQLVTDPSMIPKILREGWRKWGDVADTAENISRAATYLQNVEQKGRLRAAYEARDIMDFSQHGAWPAVRFLIRVVPFLNARLQGLDKLYRSGVKPALLTAMGKGTASDKEAAARFATVTGALTVASIALYLANADDDEYRKLEDWQKDSYWFFRIGDNAFFLPKPFEVGAIATMAERMTEQLVDDKATGKLFADRLKDMMTQTFSFSPVPQMFQPVLDIYSNTDAFTGRDIESMGMERLSKGLRSRENTTAAGTALSAVSRALGDESLIALSPVQADHLIRGYFGTVGTNAAGIIDTVWRGATGQESPDKRWSEYQPIRRFYRDLGAPAPYSRYSTLFYDGLREANRVYADVRELQGLGRTAEAQDVKAENRNILAMRQRLNQQQRRVSDINKQMEMVKRSDSDGAWKRRELDRLTLMRNRITEQLGRQIESVRAE